MEYYLFQKSIMKTWGVAKYVRWALIFFLAAENWCGPLNASLGADFSGR